MPTLLITLLPLALLFTPTQAHALSTECQQILSLPPISSHYVKRVLARADQGLKYAAEGDAAEPFPFFHWAQWVTATLTNLTDVRLQVGAQQQDLLINTACLRFDIDQIECKISQVRDALREALDRGSIIQIIRLQSLVRYLNERQLHLITGARSHHYPDPSWGNRYLFDRPDQDIWCCPTKGPREGICTKTSVASCGQDYEGTAHGSIDQCTAQGCREPNDIPEGQETLCPAHSDYYPPSMDGYGCDLDVLESRSAVPTLREEAQALRFLMEQVDKYNKAGSSSSSAPAIPLPGSSSSRPMDDRKHVRAYGCLLEEGVCVRDPEVVCRRNKDCEDKELGWCVPIAGHCELNTDVQCWNDGDCNKHSLGKCIEGQPPGLLAREARGPFRVERNHIQILRDFLALRFWQGESRELPDYLKYPGEFPENKKVQREEAEQIVPPESYERDNKRIVFREWSGLQGGWEAGIFPQATDAQLEIAQAMAGLRKEVRTFAELAHDPGEKGLRKFVKTFAYYLRRTCIERPCSARLEQILRIAYEDECFPYTNGLFLGDSTDKPRWKECAKAACVPLAGVTLNAARCQCYTYQAPGPPQPVAPSNTPPPDFCVKKNDSNP